MKTPSDAQRWQELMRVIGPGRVIGARRIATNVVDLGEALEGRDALKEVPLYEWTIRGTGGESLQECIDATIKARGEGR